MPQVTVEEGNYFNGPRVTVEEGNLFGDNTQGGDLVARLGTLATTFNTNAAANTEAAALLTAAAEALRAAQDENRQLKDELASYKKPEPYELIDAVRHLQTQTVRDLLQRGADPNEQDTMGFTALELAVKRGGADIQGSADIVRALISAGAGIESRDYFKDRTPLIEAAQLGQANTVKFLIESGADVNAKDRDGNTALIEAAASGNTKIVRALLDAGADAEAKDDYGSTALSLAKYNGYGDVTNILTDAAGSKKEKPFNIYIDDSISMEFAGVLNRALTAVVNFARAGATVNAAFYNNDLGKPLDLNALEISDLAKQAQKQSGEFEPVIKHLESKVPGSSGHFIIINDGDLFTKKGDVARLEKVLRANPEITLDFVSVNNKLDTETIKFARELHQQCPSQVSSSFVGDGQAYSISRALNQIKSRLAAQDERKQQQAARPAYRQAPRPGR